MPHRIRQLLSIVGAYAFGLAAQTFAAAPAENTLEIVVGNGPHAGTYKPPADSVICMHAKKQKRYSAAWKDFDAHDAKAIAEAGINVSNPDDAGAKQGEVRITFGDPDKKPTVYSVDRAPPHTDKDGHGRRDRVPGKNERRNPASRNREMFGHRRDVTIARFAYICPARHPNVVQTTYISSDSYRSFALPSLPSYGLTTTWAFCHVPLCRPYHSSPSTPTVAGIRS